MKLRDLKIGQTYARFPHYTRKITGFGWCDGLGEMIYWTETIGESVFEHKGSTSKAFLMWLRKYGIEKPIL